MTTDDAGATITDRPCSCGDPDCPWNGAADVIAELDAARSAADTEVS